jgi:hypothetical protein
MTEQQIAQEVARITAGRDARRKAAKAEFEKYKLLCLKQRLAQFEEGRLGMCSCSECIAGYVALKESRLCREGHRQFALQANGGQRWVP